MKAESVLWIIAGIAALLLVAFWKQRVCIGPDGTPRGPFPWIIPCSSTEQSVVA